MSNKMGKLNIPENKMALEIQERIHALHERWRQELRPAKLQPGHMIASIAHFLCLAIMSTCEDQQEGHVLLNIVTDESHLFLVDNWHIAKEYQQKAEEDRARSAL